MRRLFVILILLATAGSSIPTQATLSGRWRAVVLLPDFTTRDLTLDLETNGSTVTGAISGAPVTLREGRVEGSTVRLRTVNQNDAAQESSFTGQLAGNEIVFKMTGLTPEPIQFVARRDTRDEINGSVSDAALMQRLLKQFNVPGVSIAIIKDFTVAQAFAYGLADVETGSPITTGTMFQAASISKPVAAMASLRAVQKGRFTLDQDVNTILKRWKLPGDGFTTGDPVTPRTLLSHTSGMGDAFGFPGYASGAALPALPQILDGVPPSNLRKVRLERAPLQGFEYSGGAVTLQQLALEDAAGKPFAQIAREWVLDPIGMSNSTYEQPLPSRLHAQAARAHNRVGARMDDPWHVYPEQAAAGLWTTPTDLARFAIAVQLAVLGRSNAVLSPALAREMITPVGVGPFAIGFQISKQGEGWYFAHGGSNWGFQCDLTAHRLKGYGAVIMTNSDSGGPLIQQLRRLIQREYGWDALGQPIPRRYGPP